MFLSTIALFIILPCFCFEIVLPGSLPRPSAALFSLHCFWPRCRRWHLFVEISPSRPFTNLSARSFYAAAAASRPGDVWKPVCALAKSDCGSNCPGHYEVCVHFTPRCENLGSVLGKTILHVFKFGFLSFSCTVFKLYTEHSVIPQNPFGQTISVICQRAAIERRLVHQGRCLAHLKSRMRSHSGKKASVASMRRRQRDS